MDKLSIALRQYEREQREKRAVLLIPDGGYYLFGRQFCGIREYELSLAGGGLQGQGTSVPCSIFLGIVGNNLQWAVKDTEDLILDRLSLIFHIALEEDELLRGILFARQQTAYLSLFTDPGMEELYRAASQPVQIPLPVIAASEELSAYARNCARNDLHTLTELYLCGSRLSQLREVAGI